MYVCVCRQITDKQIHELCRAGASTMAEVKACLGVASECGKCAGLARAIVSEYQAKPQFSTPYVKAA